LKDWFSRPIVKLNCFPDRSEQIEIWYENYNLPLALQ
jgi:hypothetical protein